VINAEATNKMSKTARLILGDNLILIIHGSIQWMTGGVCDDGSALRNRLCQDTIFKKVVGFAAMQAFIWI
jgi:hypothetical protein